MRTRGEGEFQWKQTSAFTHVSLVIWFKEWASALTAAHISNRAGQTRVTDTSCTTAPALRLQMSEMRFLSPTVTRALSSHSPTDVAWSRLHEHYTRRPNATIAEYTDTSDATVEAVEDVITSRLAPLPHHMCQQGAALVQRILCLSFATCLIGCSRHLLMLIPCTCCNAI